jgi:hypothetical protein
MKLIPLKNIEKDENFNFIWSFSTVPVIIWSGEKNLRLILHLSFFLGSGIRDD